METYNDILNNVCEKQVLSDKLNLEHSVENRIMVY